MKPAFVVLALLLFSGFAKADATYDYVGAQFLSPSGNLVCSFPNCNVTGQLVVAQPLAPSTTTTFDLAANPPAFWTFTGGGAITLGPTSPLLDPSVIPSTIQVTTDAAGVIDQYNVQIFGISPYHTAFELYKNPGQYNNDFFAFNNFGSGAPFLTGAGATTTSGIWTEEKAVSTPEPSSTLLLASGLGLLVLLGKRSY